jgi:hypothetical protein
MAQTFVEGRIRGGRGRRGRRMNGRGQSTTRAIMARYD